MFYINNELETTERYDAIKFFNFDEDNIESLDSYFNLMIPKLSEIGSLTITNEEGRPDLISYKLYNSTQYWWIILIYNHILDIQELKTGYTIKYPSLNSIENLYTQASLNEKVS
jgi:hypothetical protein